MREHDETGRTDRGAFTQPAHRVRGRSLPGLGEEEAAARWRRNALQGD